MLVLLVALLFAAILAGRPLFGSLDEWIAADPDRAFERVERLILGLAVMSVPLLIMGIVSLRLGRRAVDTGRFPPAGMPVVVDTPICRGGIARRRGRLVQIVGILIALIAVGFPSALWLILHRVAGDL